MAKRIICISEAGWRGIRRLSLLLNELRIANTVWINARPSGEVRGAVWPKLYVRNYFIPRLIFRVVIFGAIFFQLCLGRVRAIVVVRDKTLKLLGPPARLARVPIYVLEEVDHGFKLYRDGNLIARPEDELARFQP